MEHVIDEMLEERAVSSRGQRKPCGWRQKMSKYAVRRRGQLSREEHEWMPEILPPVTSENP